MAMMILLCWSSEASKPYIYVLKFIELLFLNAWSISSVAIALLITNIVKVRVPASTCYHLIWSR